MIIDIVRRRRRRPLHRRTLAVVAVAMIIGIIVHDYVVRRHRPLHRRTVAVVAVAMIIDIVIHDYVVLTSLSTTTSLSVTPSPSSSSQSSLVTAMRAALSKAASLSYAA